ncbi:MAG: TIGR00725 family protein [Chloroflexota bacterium]|nr:TIGR00725 family protein [Chloroflexota bacterium]MEC9366574.1 TIGR00725 family protein [Chloroflexota bacterium]MED5429253.1 TIGR00725 family protein [Chloroflexota bacterium]
MIIAVIGESTTSPENAILAEKVGSLLAMANVTIVCGGQGGVMESVCKGAKKNGGTTIGILPGVDPLDSNEYIDIPICTGLGNGRNLLVIRAGQAVIAIGGAYGTLSEIGLALSESKQVIGLNTWSLMKNEKIDCGIIVADSPEQAVKIAISQAN